MTCGVDNNIKLWNFNTKTVELTENYGEEVLSVSLHPTGDFCALALVLGFKLGQILKSKILVYFEQPCRVNIDIR